MAELRPASPFGAVSRDVGSEAVSIAFLPARAALGLKVHRLTDAATLAVAEAAGIPLPSVPNTVAGERRRWLWLGPGEWLLVDDHSLDGVAGRLTGALDGIAHVVAPLGPALAVVEIAGSAARDLLAKGCPLDLRPRHFPVGSCARTLLDQLRVTLHLRRPDPAFDLYVDVSVARHAAAWLLDAAAEFL